MEIDYKDYSLINLLKICIKFISKYPLSLLEIGGYRMLFNLILIPLIMIITMIILIFFIILEVGLLSFLQSCIPETKPIMIVMSLPLALTIAFAPIISGGVVEAKVFHKYSRPSEKPPSMLGTFFSTYYQVLLNAFSWDFLIALFVSITFSFLGTIPALICSSIAVIYLVITIAARFAKLVYLPYATYLYKPVEGNVSDFIRRVPLSSVILMLFYVMIVINIFNTPLGLFKMENTYLVISYVVEGFKFEHFLFLIVTPLSLVFINILQIVYFDIRVRESFAKTTKIANSIWQGIGIMAFITFFSFFVISVLNNNDQYQANYVKKHTAEIVMQAMEERQGRVYQIMNWMYKGKLDHDIAYEDLPEDVKEQLQENLRTDLNAENQ